MKYLNRIRSYFSSLSAPFITVAGAAFVLALFGIVSRVLGMIRDRILASTYGASDILDVYYASFRIPDLVYSLLVLGALSAAFIPVFTEVSKKQSDTEAWKLASRILWLLSGTITVLAIVFVLFLPFLVQIITPGFDIEKQQQVVEFTRIMFLSPLLLGMSAVFGGILVSKKCFWAYSLAPIFYNIGIILGVVVIAPKIGPEGLAWGVVFGAFLHFLVQSYATRKFGNKLVVFKNIRQIWHDIYVRKIVLLMLPRTLTIAANQVNLFIITIFASTLATGSLTAFNLANNLQSIPLAIFGISFAVAAFPKLSDLAASEETQEFIHTLQRTMRRILFFVMPASMFLYLLRAEVVRVILGAGAFDWEDTNMTLDVLGALTLSLFAQSLLPLLARAFYSLQNTMTPFYIALVSEVVNIVLAIVLVDSHNITGLAIAFGVASVVNASLLIVFLRRRLGNFDSSALKTGLLKIALATIIAGVITQGMKTLSGSVVDTDTFVGIFIKLCVSGLAGLTAYVGLCYFLKIEEFFDFKQKVLIKVFGKVDSPAVHEQHDIDKI